MEIEGLINHTLAAALVEREYIAKQLQENLAHIDFWKTVKLAHSHEELKHRLQGITHIRQILGSDDYMQHLIKKSVDEPLYFMGFPIKVIEFYLHLLSEMNKYRPEENQV